MLFAKLTIIFEFAKNNAVKHIALHASIEIIPVLRLNQG